MMQHLPIGAASTAPTLAYDLASSNRPQGRDRSVMACLVVTEMEMYS
jgi:hypothetical protein